MCTDKRTKFTTAPYSEKKMDVQRYVTLDKLFDIENDVLEELQEEPENAIDFLGDSKDFSTAIRKTILRVVEIMESPTPEGELSIYEAYQICTNQE